MIEIIEQNPREILEIVLRIWESSVRATHKFLNRSEIERIKGEVEAMFAQMDGVICAKFDGEIAALDQRGRKDRGAFRE